jgi:hypothetical protein
MGVMHKTTPDSHSALSVLFVLYKVKVSLLVNEPIAAVGRTVGALLLLKLEGGAPLLQVAKGLIVLKRYTWL